MYWQPDTSFKCVVERRIGNFSYEELYILSWSSIHYVRKRTARRSSSSLYNKCWIHWALGPSGSRLIAIFILYQSPFGPKSPLYNYAGPKSNPGSARKQPLFRCEVLRLETKKKMASPRTITIVALSLALGLFFVFMGTIKLTPRLSKDAYSEMVSLQK